MNMQELRQKAGEALRGQKKAQVIDAVHGAMSQVEQRERDRLACVGRVEAAEFARRQAQGELEAAESNLQRAVEALEAEIAKAGEQ
jgi:hypothetical protein